MLLVYLVVVSPLLSLEESWSQELTRKRQLLAKYQNLIQSKAQVLEANQEHEGRPGPHRKPVSLRLRAPRWPRPNSRKS